MNCRVCKQRAAVEIRRHNAAFCPDHFVEHVQRQVARTIHDYEMFGPDDRLLLGVSGGKDSLALWDILTGLGYAVDGVYLHLGIGEYSSESLILTEQFAAERDLALRVVDLPVDYGFSIPQAAATQGRSACSVCGLSKRYLLNDAAAGYDALVMGHNLDDEAATLLGNVLKWNTEYLGRQAPVLPAVEGLARKVKPLIRVAERETAAYAVLRGIEYEVEECPMVAGNTINRLKERMSVLEANSPGVKQQFLFGFFERGAGHFEVGEKTELGSCRSCGSPTTGDVCAFCRVRDRATHPLEVRES
ncbi:MAG: TIGR00269 family protein [Acidimicrobiia bacterium]|nr:TIGR00269 family protein [Acidimicrobiia bacterium]MDH3397532.1 TIGR00269 family protein [Acidimicrobiia bacterium]